ncbi:hypothetical protein FOA52_011695 [Chlamydomonas sp. UWO 241]|nr:hypothetical protein FOA52_011695 [Chlamydomonas sp. UWO 241]
MWSRCMIIVVEAVQLGGVESFELIAADGSVNIVNVTDDTACSLHLVPYNPYFTWTVDGGTSYLVKTIRMNVLDYRLTAFDAIAIIGRAAA